ncbi:MAG: hypothetical protein ABEJ43_11015 [Haloferacaceae archaeon]
MSDDPTTVRSIAVTRDDVVRALELRERGGPRAVLRVTPPFAGRMRARLHVEGKEGEYDDPAPVHIVPERLVRGPPPLPTVDEAEDALRAADEYSLDRQRARHERAVEGWRRAVGAQVVGEVTVETPAGPHRVEVRVLG